MIVVFPFFAGDEPLALKNLSWIQRMEPQIDAECLLAYDYQTKPERVAAVAEQVFKKVHLYSYKPPPDRKWPKASNWVFQHVAWHMYNNFKEPWLWLESDCVPLKAGWYQAIKECHVAGGKPFTGHWNYTTKVWNGVSVYPWNTPELAGKNAMLCVNNPWDVWASKDIFPQLNIANHLFQHIWQDDQTGQAWEFPDAETVKRVVREGVVLFHRCKSGSLIDRLIGVADEAKSTAPQFIHGGDVGDLIYALPTMKALGPGKLFMVPHTVREAFSEQKVEKLAPLLKLQPYLSGAVWSPEPPSRGYNFNRFRKFYRKGKTLALMQSELFGLNGTTIKEKWLTVDRPVTAGDYKVILHRSGRYNNPAFPWKKVVEKYGKQALMVGIEKEWAMFTKEFGHVEYHRTADFLELARLIAGAKLFVGNQSAPYAIAEGLKQPAVLESHPTTLDCQYHRPNLWNDSKCQFTLPDV